MMTLLQLFLSYLKIGFFGFGGGYAMLSLIHSEVVVSHQWLTNSELTAIVVWHFAISPIWFLIAGAVAGLIWAARGEEVGR